MNNNNLTKRLVEYFIVVGIDEFEGLSRAEDQRPFVISNEPQDKASDDVDDLAKAKLKVGVLSRYPDLDHADVPFPSGVPVFCFPNGGAELTDRMEMPKFFEFVSTGDNGSHIFGFVLLIYEPINRELYTESMIESEITFHAPKCLCLLSHWPFRSQFRTFLTTLYRLSLSPITAPLERVVSNFVSEVPLPPAGRIRVQYQVGDTELTFTRPPANNPISWTDIGFQQVFECLDLQNILLVFSALLTERQVLVRSSQLSLLGACGEAFRALIYPLVWSHVYIPVLPYAMLMVMQAPLPYLIGIHEDTFRLAIEEGYEIPPTAVVVDLDRNKVMVSSKDFAIMELPMHDCKKLLGRIQQCAPAFERRSMSWSEDELPNMDLAISHAARPYEIDDDTAAYVRKIAQSGSDYDASGVHSVWRTLPDGSCNWPMVRTAFFRFFVSILRDYREFLVYPVQKPGSPRRRGMSRAQREAALGSFNAEGFLMRRRRANERNFMAVLVDTQHFQCFIAERLHPDGAHDADVVFFEQSLEAKLNRSFFTKLIPGMKAETPFLDDRQYSISKTVVANGPDQTPVLLATESWMPLQPHFGYERFPRLRVSLFGLIRPMPDTGAEMERSEGLLANKSHLLRKHRTPGHEDDDFGSASDAIYATWFILFCSSIGRQTENWLAIEQYDARLGPFSGRMSVDSTSSSVRTMTELDPDSGRVRADSDASSQFRGGTRMSVSSYDEVKRAETSLIDLATAFEVLEASQQWSNAVDEIVYRALIDACGRCGATDHAIRVLGMMHESGVTVDSLIYSNFVQSFSMNGDARSFKMDILDWKKLRQEVKAANQRIERSMRELAHRSFASSTGSSSGSRARRHRLNSGIRSRKGTLVRQLQTATPPLPQHGRTMSGGGSEGVSGGHKRVASDSLKAFMLSSFTPESGGSSSAGSDASPMSPALRTFASTGTPLPSVRRTMQHWGSRSRAPEGCDSADMERKPSTSSRSSAANSAGRKNSRFDASRMFQSFMFGNNKQPSSPPVESTRSQNSAISSPGLYGALSQSGDSSPEADMVAKSLPVSPAASTPPPHLEPLTIQISTENLGAIAKVSGPGGSSSSSSEQQNQQQSQSDAEPASAGLRAERLDLDHIFPCLEIDTERETCPQCNRMIHNDDIRKGWDTDPNDYNTECPSCGRKFVAFFTVFSSDEEWVGSRGPCTPLFCEFLPPWALSKEVRTILENHSIDYVCCPAFREYKATVFWNLVLYFSEFSLPLEFLTGPPATDPDFSDIDAFALNAIGVVLPTTVRKSRQSGGEQTVVSSGEESGAEDGFDGTSQTAEIEALPTKNRADPLKVAEGLRRSSATSISKRALSVETKASASLITSGSHARLAIQDATSEFASEDEESKARSGTLSVAEDSFADSSTSASRAFDAQEAGGSRAHHHSLDLSFAGTTTLGEPASSSPMAPPRISHSQKSKSWSALGPDEPRRPRYSASKSPSTALASTRNMKSVTGDFSKGESSFTSRNVKEAAIRRRSVVLDQ